jgi:CheY-like chemotaxis protein
MESRSKASFRVLIVTDDRISAAMFSRTLRSHGFDVVAIAGGALDAVQLAAVQDAELAVVDVGLSGELDGIDTVHLLRDRFIFPIVLVAAEGDDDTRARASAVEPEAFLLKPVREAELVLAVRKALAVQRVEALGREAAPFRSENTRVLVVDDEYRVRFSIANTLAAMRCEVRQAGSAEAALEVLSNDREFDLVLCDMMMPRMTGAELFDRLSSEHPHLARRFAFVSAGATNSGDEAMMRSKGVRLLLKPFTPEDLLAFVGEQLSRLSD